MSSLQPGALAPPRRRPVAAAVPDADSHQTAIGRRPGRSYMLMVGALTAVVCISFFSFYGGRASGSKGGRKVGFGGADGGSDAADSGRDEVTASQLAALIQQEESREPHMHDGDDDDNDGGGDEADGDTGMDQRGANGGDDGGGGGSATATATGAATGVREGLRDHNALDDDLEEDEEGVDEGRGGSRRGEDGGGGGKRHGAKGGGGETGLAGLQDQLKEQQQPGDAAVAAAGVAVEAAAVAGGGQEGAVEGAAAGDAAAEQQAAAAEDDEEEVDEAAEAAELARVEAAAETEGRRHRAERREQEVQDNREAAAGEGEVAAADAAADADSEEAAAKGDGGEEQAAGREAGGSSGGEQQEEEQSPYHRALLKCKDLACLKEAAELERHPGQFLFPNFLIIGWQKCATTSLFHHLVTHPNVVCPAEKEPEFFSYDCEYNPLACPLEEQFQYINNTLRSYRVFKSNLRRAAFEASTHYAREGHRIAQGVAQVFPWLKLIASMREPISRHISMLAHNLDKGAHGCLASNGNLYHCLKYQLPVYNYTQPFTAWLDAYPREQILLLQYESLTSPEEVVGNLRKVKTFLSLDPELPSNELAERNMRAQRLGATPEGWPMKKSQYQKIVDLVRPDSESIAEIVTTYGFGDGKAWMAKWEAAWQANLDSCGKDGMCTIQLT